MGTSSVRAGTAGGVVGWREGPRLEEGRDGSCAEIAGVNSKVETSTK